MNHPTLIERLERRQLFSAYIINGVQAVALDQPQIHGLFRTSATGSPLTESDPIFGGTTFDVPGYLDTGTSNILLSQEDAQALGVQSSTYNNKSVVFTDVGIGGGQTFDVSKPLYVSTANYEPNIDGTDLTTFTQNFGPLRTEVNQQAADPNLATPLDIYGMPVLQGKVAVFDPGPIDALGNMNSYIYNPGTPYHAATASSNPGIPATNLHVKLSYGSFDNFTTISPSGAPGPTLSSNPFIGPDPIALLSGQSDGTPAISISQGGLSGSGSFLFDTGAVTSFISSAMAGKVHVYYKAGTKGTANPVLVDSKGKVVPNQFTEPIGGVGGSVTAAGFFLDSLTLPTVEGTPIVFTHAPVLVLDVTTQNPTTHQTLTLDGDFGMNYLVSSTDASLAASHTGDFKWITFDQPSGVLGLDLPGVTPTKTGSIAGTVFNDMNADGIRQSTESGTAGFTITLHNKADASPTTIDASAVSDSKGNYTFGNLKPGTYVVTETARTGWRATSAVSKQITVTSGQTAAGPNFLNTQKTIVSGTLFNDKNNNGKLDPGEALAGWRIYIQTTSTPGYVKADPSTLTDKNGNWTINNLPTGNYTIRVVQMSGYKLTSPAVGYLAITLAAGQAASGKSFIEKHS